MNAWYFAALATGLIGSLHCIGMCGPIAVALPLGTKSWGFKSLGTISYNIGRTITYGVLGALFGLLGQGIQLAGLQQWASILIGVVMIVSVIFPAVFRSRFNPDRIFTGYAARLIGKFRQLFRRSTLSNLFLIGLLNGLLPCGLVYVAIAGAIAMNTVAGGTIYMLIFGLGTIPVMMAISLAGNLVGTGIRRKLKGTVSVFIVILGILFVLRGLSLGIPYISPKTKMLQPREEMKQMDAGREEIQHIGTMCH